MQHRTRTIPAVAAVLSLVVATLPVNAAADDDPWEVRLSVVSMQLNGSRVDVPGAGELYSYIGSNGAGFAIDLEYRATKRLGIDFGLITASPSIGVEVYAAPLTVSASADLTITPLYVGANFHLLPESRFDLYVGPMVAYVFHHSFDLVAGPGVTERFSAENRVGIGAALGADIALGSGRWSLTTAVRYIDTSLDASPTGGGSGSADINPTIYSLGFGYRF
jgi:outer membrane protein W